MRPVYYQTTVASVVFAAAIAFLVSTPTATPPAKKFTDRVPPSVLPVHKQIAQDTAQAVGAFRDVGSALKMAFGAFGAKEACDSCADEDHEPPVAALEPPSRPR